MVDLPPENGSKEMPASVEPEQRVHANNSNEEPSLQDQEEQEHLRDQDDDAIVHRRNNDGPPSEAPLGETDEERADPNNGLLQDRSGDGSYQGQGN